MNKSKPVETSTTNEHHNRRRSSSSDSSEAFLDSHSPSNREMQEENLLRDAQEPSISSGTNTDEDSPSSGTNTDDDIPTSERPILRRTDSENDLFQARVSSWFREFVIHTDQKTRMGNAFSTLFQKMKEHSVELIPSYILDIGFGEGELSTKIAEAYKKFFATKDLVYRGIDYDANFVESTKTALQNLGLSDHQIDLCQGDCFSNDLEKLQIDASLVVVANLLYYAKDEHTYNQFISHLKPKLSRHGMIVFMHESSRSQMNEMRQKYKASTDTHTTSNIKTTTWNNGSEIISFPFLSTLTFPEDSMKFFTTIKGMAQGIAKPMDEHKALCHQVKRLLEFVVQRPLEHLQKESDPCAPGKTLLDSYMGEIEELLSKQNNTLKIRSSFQLVLSQQAPENYKGELRKICSEMKKEFSPDNYFDLPSSNINYATSARKLSSPSPTLAHQI